MEIENIFQPTTLSRQKAQGNWVGLSSKEGWKAEEGYGDVWRSWQPFRQFRVKHPFTREEVQRVESVSDVKGEDRSLLS